MRVEETKNASVKTVRPRMTGWVFVVRMMELRKLDIGTEAGEVFLVGCCFGEVFYIAGLREEYWGLETVELGVAGCKDGDGEDI